MTYVPITLNNISPSSKNLEPITVSVPFKNGEIYNTNTLELIDGTQAINKQITVLAYWPNMSVKWIQVDFLFSNTAKKEATVFLKSTASKIGKFRAGCIQVHESTDHITIETKSSLFQVNKIILGSFIEQSKSNNAEAEIKKCYKSTNDTFLLTDSKGGKHEPIIENIYFSHPDTSTNHSIKFTLSLKGYFQPQNSQDNSLLQSKQNVTQFEAEITFYYHSNITQWRFTIHNPQAMKNNNGTWDLGNENSLFFRSLHVLVPCKNQSSLTYKIKDELVPSSNNEQNWHNGNENFCVFQASSGGKNWQSDNHVDHQNKNCIEFNGYKLSPLLDQNINADIIEGRALPTIFVKQRNQNIESTISVHIKNFWQKFPKSIEVEPNKITLGLFPEQAKAGFELQPGEKKSDVFYIVYDEQNNVLTFIESPTQVTISSEYMAATKTIPFLPHTDDEIKYNAIINDGINSSNNFFQKRELIDEFGWRNFGDLYADHETLEVEGDNELISHYNNQYDPLYGFLRRYLLTKNQQWLTLANDLADHVKNIDIYHTTQDKVEYNGGLFWHTDHYLPAKTASHRTYSQKQVANAYQDHAGGGGPGGQHCYTTGLMLHFFLTGDESSKNAVLQLTHWITSVYEGSGGIGDFLLAIKNKNRIDLKNISTGKYPLDRGTAHYVIALIDSFELTNKQSFLDSASLIIKNTIHPSDDVDARHLDNIEVCWFYTVFLQAVYRYLQVKEKLKQFDSSFQYARDALLQYAVWMCKNERPTLETPEVLEYPNHTWAAQDIRKANILFFAHYYAYSNTKESEFITKANELYNYVVSTLAKEPTRSFTRILSILMQNHGIKSYVEQNFNRESLSHLPRSEAEEILSQPKLVSAFISTLSNTSISKELEWLKIRSSMIANLLKKIGK